MRSRMCLARLGSARPLPLRTREAVGSSPSSRSHEAVFLTAHCGCVNNRQATKKRKAEGEEEEEEAQDKEAEEADEDGKVDEDGEEDPIEPAVLTGKSVGAAQSFDTPPRKMASIHTGSTAVDVQLTYVFLTATNGQRV